MVWRDGPALRFGAALSAEGGAMKRSLGRLAALASLPLVFPLLAQPIFDTASPRFTITDLGTLGGSFSEAFGINNAGTVVGDAATGSGAVHAVLYSGGVRFGLALPGAGGQ